MVIMAWHANNCLHVSVGKGAEGLGTEAYLLIHKVEE
jgi:hypothetical protein